MELASWPVSGKNELAISFDESRQQRLMVLPALFDEANKLRRFTVEVMRLLDGAGVDSFLPDLPGTNESLAPLDGQSLTSWRNAARQAARHFKATHTLAVRAASLLAPDLPTLHYAPVTGVSTLRGLARKQAMAEREAGHDIGRDELLAAGRTAGVVLAGYPLGPAMVLELEEAEPVADPAGRIAQGELGGGGLWLRAEPGHDAAQAERLAELVLEWLAKADPA